MPTLGDTLQAKLSAAKAALTVAENEVAELVDVIASAEPSWLERDIEDVRAFFSNVGHHL